MEIRDIKDGLKGVLSGLWQIVSFLSSVVWYILVAIGVFSSVLLLIHLLPKQAMSLLPFMILLGSFLKIFIILIQVIIVGLVFYLILMIAEDVSKKQREIRIRRRNEFMDEIIQDIEFRRMLESKSKGKKK
jgi:predicted membrane protein